MVRQEGKGIQCEPPLLFHGDIFVSRKQWATQLGPEHTDVPKLLQAESY